MQFGAVLTHMAEEHAGLVSGGQLCVQIELKVKHIRAKALSRPPVICPTYWVLQGGCRQRRGPPETVYLCGHRIARS